MTCAGVLALAQPLHDPKCDRWYQRSLIQRTGLKFPRMRASIETMELTHEGDPMWERFWRTTKLHEVQAWRVVLERRGGSVRGPCWCRSSCRVPVECGSCRWRRYRRAKATDAVHSVCYLGDSLRMHPQGSSTLRWAASAALVDLDDRLSRGEWVARLEWQCSCALYEGDVSGPRLDAGCHVHGENGVLSEDYWGSAGDPDPRARVRRCPRRRGNLMSTSVSGGSRSTATGRGKTEPE